jgi:recombination protein RecA
MAKKKKSDNSVEETQEVSNNIVAMLAAKYGKEGVVNAKSVVDRPQHTFSISPKLDIGLNGGIPEGSWVILSGAPKCGKSSLALWIAALAQKPENGSRNTYYVDAEGRLKKMNLMGTKGLDLDKITVIQSSPERIFSAEEFLESCEMIIKNDPGCVLIIDSSSALCSSKEQTDELTGQNRSLGPKLFSSFCKRMGTIVPVQRTTVIIIQHLIANTSGYGPAQMEDGGRKLQYQVDVKLRCKGVEKWEEGTDEKKQVGQMVKWDVMCSALGSPGNEVVMALRYGEGIDEVSELIEVCCDLGIITKGGAWYTIQVENEIKKICGMQALREFIVNNPEVLQSLKDQYKAIL